MKQEFIRKLSAAVAMSLVVGVSLAACGGSSSSTAAGVTKTGSAEGFGGAVTATLTVDANGTVALLPPESLHVVHRSGAKSFRQAVGRSR